jgi:hypothetical protein
MRGCVVQVRFKNELERNITIKLGYANAKIYKCEDDSCPRPQTYRAYGSSKEDAPTCEVPGFQDKRMQLLRHVSFVDCPGHDILMATMLNGAAVMDGALLLIAGASCVLRCASAAACLYRHLAPRAWLLVTRRGDGTQATRRAHSRRHRSIWRQWRSCGWRTLSFCRTRSI